MFSTIVADLGDPDLDIGSFDCVICVQTVQLIFDTPTVFRNLRSLVAPGGTLFVTAHGVSQLDGSGNWGEFWRFSPAAMRRLLEAEFGSGNVEVASFGNVLSATAFLHGLSARELRRASSMRPILGTPSSSPPEPSRQRDDTSSPTGARCGVEPSVGARDGGLRRARRRDHLPLSPVRRRASGTTPSLRVPRWSKRSSGLPAAAIASSSLEEIVDAQRGAGPPMDRAVAFTMDDGYEDQGEIAALFGRFDCPVTIFLTTGFIDGSVVLWWDQLAEILKRAEGDVATELPDGPLHISPTDPRRPGLRALEERCKAWTPEVRDRRLPRSPRPPARTCPINRFAAAQPMTWDDAPRARIHGARAVRSAHGLPSVLRTPRCPAGT